MHQQVKVYALDRSGFAFETNESELDVKVERHILLNITPQIPELQTQKTIHSVDPFTVFVEIENVGVDDLCASINGLTENRVFEETGFSTWNKK